MNYSATTEWYNPTDHVLHAWVHLQSPLTGRQHPPDPAVFDPKQHHGYVSHRRGKQLFFFLPKSVTQLPSEFDSQLVRVSATGGEIIGGLVPQLIRRGTSAPTPVLAQFLQDAQRATTTTTHKGPVADANARLLERAAQRRQA